MGRRVRGESVTHFLYPSVLWEGTIRVFVTRATALCDLLFRPVFWTRQGKGFFQGFE
jgi:hypothetical protein